MTFLIPYSQLGYAGRQMARDYFRQKQNDRCYHCGELLDGNPSQEVMETEIDWTLFPRGFLGTHVHIHHDHDTDKVLGLVHAKCNAYLWQYLGE